MSAFYHRSLRGALARHYIGRMLDAPKSEWPRLIHAGTLHAVIAKRPELERVLSGLTPSAASTALLRSFLQ